MEDSRILWWARGYDDVLEYGFLHPLSKFPGAAKLTSKKELDKLIDNLVQYRARL